ncbi:hypothetical protein EJB05_09731, partial [Eragrostis curvula]
MNGPTTQHNSARFTVPAAASDDASAAIRFCFPKPDPYWLSSHRDPQMESLCSQDEEFPGMKVAANAIARDRDGSVFIHMFASRNVSLAILLLTEL